MIYRLARTLTLLLLLAVSPEAFGADATPVGPPTAPTTVSARLANPGSTTNTDVIVEWSGGSDGGSAVTGYQVTPYTGTDYSTSASVSCSTPGPNLSDSCTVSGLAFATSYKFKVTRTTAISSATSGFTDVVTTGSQAQTVSISGTPTSYRYGDPDFQLSATASSGLAVAWSIPTTTDICSVDLSGTVHFLKSGSCTIRATQDGNGSAYQSAYQEVTVSSTVSLTATLGTATSVQSSQATLNAIVPFAGVDVTPTFCVSTTNTVSSCTLPSGVNIGSYSPSIITATSSTNLSAVASGLRQNTTYYFWLTVTGSGASAFSTGTGSFTTVSGPSLSYSGGTSGTAGGSLSGTLTASSGSGVYASWSAASLPTGLSFSPGVTATTSTISGTLSTAGNYTALFTVTDSSGLETQLNVSFTIAEPASNNSNNNSNNNSSNNSSNNNSNTGSSSNESTGVSTGTGAGSKPEEILPTGKASSPKNDPGSFTVDNGASFEYLLENDLSVTSIVELIREDKGFSFSTMGWGVTGSSSKNKISKLEGDNPDGRITSEVAGKIQLSGFGYKPGTQIDVFAFSSPIWLGGIYASKSGEFEITITLPRSVVVGQHLIRIIGSGIGEKKLTANIPLFVIPQGASSYYIPNTLVAKTLNGPLRSTTLIKDVPTKSILSWKGEVNDKTRGVKTASIKLRLISVTPDRDFSGVILLPFQIKYSGITTNRSLALTVLPLAPSNVTHSISGVNQSTVNWVKSVNANKYLVTLSGNKICETSSNTCNFSGVAGPNSRFEVKALGADGTESNVVKSKYLQSKPRLLATVNFANNSSTLDAKAITNLQSLIQILMREGFTSINIIGYTDSIGKKAANQKLSSARAKAVSDFITGNIVGAVEAIGKGKSKPIKSNSTKDGRAANRRVEIYVY